MNKEKGKTTHHPKDGHTHALVLDSVTKHYKMGDTVVEALRGVDIQVHTGEFVAIMGPSGSGKSTLLGILGLLDKPTSGRVIVDNKDSSKMTDDQISVLRASTIGFVFQFFFLVPSLTALENVMLPLMFLNVSKGERVARATEALRMVDLADRMDHRPSELSGGQRQRCAIARAIVTNPTFILADEPTGNLDSKTGADLMNVFKKLNKDGRTIVMVTHDANIAANAERTILLRDGKIEDHGFGKKVRK